MHADVDVTEPALAILRRQWTGPLGAYPNSGGWVMPNWQFVDIVSPDDFAAEAVRWVDSGVRVVGGCCGLDPEHIAVLSRRLRAGAAAPRN
jgi:homocysteine S-methyltransferase